MGQKKLMKSVFQLYYLSSVLDREWKNELEPRCVLLMMNSAGTGHSLLALKTSLLLLEVAQNTQCTRKTRQCSPIAQLPNLSFNLIQVGLQLCMCVKVVNSFLKLV